MKRATIYNRIKLWWHGLIHFHRIVQLTLNENDIWIECFDCNSNVRKLWKSLTGESENNK